MQNQLITKYELVCNQIIEAFEKKHDCCFEFWVGKYFEAASFGDGFIFKIEDIIFDLETDQPKGLIFQWVNDDLEYNQGLPVAQNINFRSYAMGVRFVMLPEQERFLVENE